MSAPASPPNADEMEPLSAALDRLFAGRRDDTLSLGTFLAGLRGRAYPFAIAAINLPNCIPTGIPWLSTITGIPIVLLLIQQALRWPTPTLPVLLARQSLPRGKLQDFFNRTHRFLDWLERRVKPRQSWLLDQIPGSLLFAALLANAVILALPIPFDNLIPAWAIMLFAIAQLERDGLVAFLGWLASVGTIVWTILLLAAYGKIFETALEILQRFIDAIAS